MTDMTSTPEEPARAEFPSRILTSIEGYALCLRARCRGSLSGRGGAIPPQTSHPGTPPHEDRTLTAAAQLRSPSKPGQHTGCSLAPS
jgi:hypothetical protein